MNFKISQKIYILYCCIDNLIIYSVGFKEVCFVEAFQEYELAFEVTVNSDLNNDVGTTSTQISNTYGYVELTYNDVDDENVLSS